MSTKAPKAAAPKPDAAVVAPESPLVLPVVIDDRDSARLRAALERIAHGRLCGCRGDHDALSYDCPKSLAMAALGVS